MLLDDLIKNNEFPILFIGSGMSKRFLQNYPNWVELLECFWRETGSQNFYGEFNKLNDSIRKQHMEFTSDEVRQYSLIEMGSIVEEKYNNEFNNEKIKIENFSTEDAFKEKISPLKKAISLKFKDYKIIREKQGEYNKFKNMISKAQIILTTNYDTFIEDSYNLVSRYKIKTYVGQRGFFGETNGFSELYKIHGSIENPSDIIITKEDYEKFNKNSILISAKITSLMMHSPIIFIGYSLSDLNIRRIIRNITCSLAPEELYLFEKRLIVIEWKKEEKKLLLERLTDRNLGCEINVIKTDNYEKIFETISSINQGLTPSEVQKYMNVIKKLVIDKGKEGTLNTVLFSPEGINQLGDESSKKNIVVAIGGPEYIFQIPDIITYCIDYISDKDEINNEIRLRLIAITFQNPRTRLPVCKLLNEKLIDSSNLFAKEKARLKRMIPIKTDFYKTYDCISGHFIPKIIDVKSIISECDQKRKLYNTLSYYIRKLNLEDVKEYILNELNDLKKNKSNIISSELRKLMLLYDILKNKK